MNILFLTWKDKKNPASGGAESINEGIAKRLVREGHEVTFLVAGFRGGLSEEKINGYKVIRLGNRWTIYWHAFRYYKKNLENWADLVIEEVNTMPFFTQFYIHPVKSPKDRDARPVKLHSNISQGKQFNGVKDTKRILIIYQLCREIWFYQIFFPLNLIGYLLEPIYLHILNKNKCITESESTKADLQKYGFQKENISIIPIALDIEPLESLNNIEKYKEPTILSLGTIRSMKKTIDQIKAFELAKKEIPRLKLKIAGNTESCYGQKVLKYIGKSPYKSDVEYLGKIDRHKKIELLKKCHVIMVTSVKEGWGIIVTEAASQGTPAIVYNVDGLRDSVKNNETGIICKSNSPRCLSDEVIKLLSDEEEYNKLQNNAWKWSKYFSWDKTYNRFIKII